MLPPLDKQNTLPLQTLPFHMQLTKKERKKKNIYIEDLDMNDPENFIQLCSSYVIIRLCALLHNECIAYKLHTHTWSERYISKCTGNPHFKRAVQWKNTSSFPCSI